MRAEQQSLTDYLKRIAFNVVGSSRLYNYSYNKITACDASFIIALSRPLVKEYNGCYTIEDLFDISSFEKWHSFLNGDISEIERQCNRLSIASMVDVSEADPDLINLLAENMKHSWVCSITEQITCDFDVPILFDDTGSPALTFYVRR